MDGWSSTYFMSNPQTWAQRGNPDKSQRSWDILLMCAQAQWCAWETLSFCFMNVKCQKSFQARIWNDEGEMEKRNSMLCSHLHLLSAATALQCRVDGAKSCWTMAQHCCPLPGNLELIIIGNDFKSNIRIQKLLHRYLLLLDSGLKPFLL